MFCRFCGKEIGEADKFCKSCGKQVSEVAEAVKAVETKGKVKKENASKGGKKSNLRIAIIILLIMLVLSLLPGAIYLVVSKIQNARKDKKFNELYYCETESLKRASEGDYVEFGSYIQNSDEEEPIIWVVISENEDGSLVLMSRNVIDAKSVDECMDWINDREDGFIDEAFDRDEQERIITARIPSYIDMICLNEEGSLGCLWAKNVKGSDVNPIEYLFVDSDDTTIKCCDAGLSSDGSFFSGNTSDMWEYGIRPVIVITN